MIQDTGCTIPDENIRKWFFNHEGHEDHEEKEKEKAIYNARYKEDIEELSSQVTDAIVKDFLNFSKEKVRWLILKMEDEFEKNRLEIVSKIKKEGVKIEFS